MNVPKERWIEEVHDLPEKLLTCNPRYSYLQTAYHIKYTKGILKTYKKSVVRINNSNDFSNINPIQISIGDSNEEWILHSAIVYRGNSIIDKTDSLKFEELKRERGLEQNVITGTKTFIAQINDLQIGDVVCYEFTTINTNPIYSNHFEFFLQSSFAVPLYQLRLKVDYENPDRICTYREYDGFNETVTSEIDSTGRYVYEKDDIDSVILEDNIPNDRIPFSYVEFSDFKNWEEFGDLVKQGYEKIVYKNEIIEEYIKPIISNCKSKAEEIETLVNHVQKNIAYYSLSLNEYSYFPHSPDAIIHNNYGDCKDKSVLLKTLLQALGIHSSIVLVHTAFSKSLTERLPSFSCFNHVILSLEYNNKHILIDSTNPYDCFTLDNYAEPSYYSGLVLNNDTKLQVFTNLKNDVYQRNIIEHYTIKGDSAILSIQDEYYYLAFPAVTHRHTTTDKEICKKSYLDFYSRRYQAISYYSESPDQLQYTFLLDHKRHCFTITAKFKIENFWINEDDADNKPPKAYFYPTDLLEVVFRLSGTNRKFPSLWAHKSNFSVRYKIDYDFDARMGNLDSLIDNELFTYSVNTQDTPRSFIYDMHYTSKTDTIEAKDYDKQRKIVNDLLDQLGFNISLPTFKKTLTNIEPSQESNKIPNWLIGIIIIIVFRILMSLISE